MTVGHGIGVELTIVIDPTWGNKRILLRDNEGGAGEGAGRFPESTSGKVFVKEELPSLPVFAWAQIGSGSNHLVGVLQFETMVHSRWSIVNVGQ